MAGTVDTSSGLASWLAGSWCSVCAFTSVSPFWSCCFLQVLVLFCYSVVCAGGVTAWPHPTITFCNAIELWILKAPSKIVLQGLLPASGYLIWGCIKAHHKQLKTEFYPKWWVVLAIDTLLSCFTIIYQSYSGFLWDLLKGYYNFLWKQMFNVLSVQCSNTLEYI